MIRNRGGAKLAVLILAVLAFVSVFSFAATATEEVLDVEERVGLPMPEIAPRGGDGEEVTFDFSEKNLWIFDFFTLSCPYCKVYVPHLEKLHQECAELGLEVVGVCIKGRPEQALEYAQTHGATFLMTCDETAEIAKSLLGIKYVPTTIFVDSQGIIRYVQIGVDDDTYGFEQPTIDFINEMLGL